jgi:hypothetical protein
VLPAFHPDAFRVIDVQIDPEGRRVFGRPAPEAVGLDDLLVPLLIDDLDDADAVPAESEFQHHRRTVRGGVDPDRMPSPGQFFD